MKRFSMFLALAVSAMIVSPAIVSLGMAQELALSGHRHENPWAAPAGQRVAIDDLEAMLDELGHRPQRFEAQGHVFLQFTLSHNDGDRVHAIGIDTEAQTIAIVGGGFHFAPKVERATTGWYRKLAQANNRISPTQMFINDNDVLGLNTTFGNESVTSELLKKKIDQHRKNFDEVLSPLAEELGDLSEALAEL